jgi:hypothetical protein
METVTRSAPITQMKKGITRAKTVKRVTIA